MATTGSKIWQSGRNTWMDQEWANWLTGPQQIVKCAQVSRAADQVFWWGALRKKQYIKGYVKYIFALSLWRFLVIQVILR